MDMTEPESDGRSMSVLEKELLQLDNDLGLGGSFSPVPAVAVAGARHATLGLGARRARRGGPGGRPGWSGRGG